MKGSQLALVGAIFVIAIQPCYDVTGSVPNETLVARKQVQAISRKEIIFSNDSRPLSKSFEPIRIKVHYSLWEHLRTEEQNSLKQVIDRAVEKVQSILSVKRMREPLLLSRKACQGKWSEGVNKGKCGQIRKGYTGEYCLDNFKIPDSHLEGFAVYDSNITEPYNIYFERGGGLKDTDFVLYITSRSSDLCNPHKTSALAYASFCQLGEINRPIAGQVNFCPRNIKSQKFDKELLYITSIHELLHALGFSSKLFDKFMKCENDECQPWPKKVLSIRDGRMRLVTDAVVREMKNHFNCSTESEFGGPLEIVRGKATSHWDPYLMYSSVMGSKEQKPYATLIDRISLAVFEDSGWYEVQYTMADPFLWGKDQGCKFGSQDLCETQNGFCSHNLTGCHHLRLSKARCNVDTTSSKCGIFAADQTPCFQRPVNGSLYWDETYLPSSRCFLSNISNVEGHSNQILSNLAVNPRCYETKCNDEAYYVRLNGGDWILCPSGAQAKIPPYQGSVQCPSHEEICTDISLEGEHKITDNTLSNTYITIASTELFTDASFSMAKNGGESLQCLSIHMAATYFLLNSIMFLAL